MLIILTHTWTWDTRAPYGCSCPKTRELLRREETKGRGGRRGEEEEERRKFFLCIYLFNSAPLSPSL